MRKQRKKLRSKNHPFCKKTNLPGAWYHVLYHPSSTAVIFLPIWFPNLQRYVCFGIIKIFDFKQYFVDRVPGIISRRNRSRQRAKLPVVRPLGCSGCCTVACRCVCTFFWGCRKWSCRGMISVKWGKMMVIHEKKLLRGHAPPTCGQKGGSLRPLVRRGPASPNNVCEKKKKRCACSARAAGILLARRD